MGKAAVVFGALVLALSGCASDQERAAPTKRFVEHIDNPWFPLVPGTTYIYRGMKDGEPSREVLRVTHRTKVIQGVRCTVLEDRLYLSGRLEERTTDWYAQDEKGNVWYFGEETAELDERGRVTSREGSWQAGVDGAKAGIYMPAEPKVGESFRQEFYAGHAEDHFRVEDLAASVERSVHDLAGGAADRGMDSARAGGDRPQVLRPRSRNGQGAGGQGRRRAERARERYRRPRELGGSAIWLSRGPPRGGSVAPVVMTTGAPCVRGLEDHRTRDEQHSPDPPSARP